MPLIQPYLAVQAEEGGDLQSNRHARPMPSSTTLFVCDGGLMNRLGMVHKRRPCGGSDGDHLMVAERI
jgi:hypothetical protein